jgi:hypothetical protein
VVPICQSGGEAPDAQFDALLVLEIPISEVTNGDEPTAAISVLIGTDGLGGSAPYIWPAMIRGNIAIPDVDPKTWRSRKKKRTQPALASAIVTPAPMKKRRQMTDGQEQPQRSAIVEPKTRRANIFGDAPHYDPEARHRAGEKADELFREIVRRAAKRD